MAVKAWIAGKEAGPNKKGPSKLAGRAGVISTNAPLTKSHG
jgi:hypothetical protein